MESRPRIEVGACVVLAAVIVAYLIKAMGSAHAYEAGTEESAPVPCAVVARASGEVTVLDSARTQLLPAARGAGIPCGAWISTAQGHVELKHRDGFTVHVGSLTFAQFPENDLDGRRSGDPVVLFGGQVYARSEPGGGELRVITANARARIRRGSAVVVYRRSGEETQLIALEGSPSSLENRFEASRKAKVAPGEASSLDFKLMRVIPSPAQAVALSSLRPKLEDLRVPERERKLAAEKARARSDRSIAADLKAPQAPAGAGGPDREAKPSRAIASEPAATEAPPARDPEREALRKHWVDRMVAGAPGSEELLHPATAAKKAPGHAAKGGAPRARRPAAAPSSPEETEKRRLIEELSRIRED